jgi:hypothetical protein
MRLCVSSRYPSGGSGLDLYPATPTVTLCLDVGAIAAVFSGSGLVLTSIVADTAHLLSASFRAPPPSASAVAAAKQVTGDTSTGTLLAFPDPATPTHTSHRFSCVDMI